MIALERGDARSIAWDVGGGRGTWRNARATARRSCTRRRATGCDNTANTREAQPLVQAPRVVHPVERVELAARGSRWRARRASASRPAPARAPCRAPPGARRGASLRRCRRARRQRPQRDAADADPAAGEQQASARRRVRAGQRGELLRESLEAEVDVEPRGVFLEQRARMRDVGGRRGLADRVRASSRALARGGA